MILLSGSCELTIIISIIIIIIMCLSSLVLPLNQPLRLPVSDYSIFRNVCDVPSTAEFCSESTERFPDRYVFQIF